MYDEEFEREFDLWNAHPEWWADPDWESGGKVHNAYNYIFDGLRKIWHTFTPVQKITICLNAQDLADMEEWD